MSNQNSELQVIFGTGPLGQSVMRELLRQGKPVRMVNRSGRAEVPAGVEVVGGDANQASKVRELCQGASVVYQCSQPPYHEWTTKFPALQAGIVEGAGLAGAKLIVGDNLYMYGEVEGPIKEDLPYTAHTRKGRIRAQMAEAVLEAHRQGKVRAAIGRGSDFYGPHVLDSTIGDRVFIPALSGKKASAIGNIDLPHTYTYIDDFGRGLVTLGQHEHALGQTWHIPNAPTITTRELINHIYEELGQPAQMSGMGRTMLRIGGLFIPGARETVEMMYEFEKPFVVDHSKFEQAFGAQTTPHREAIRQTIEWYREHLAQSTSRKAA